MEQFTFSEAFYISRHIPTQLLGVIDSINATNMGTAILLALVRIIPADGDVARHYR